MMCRQPLYKEINGAALLFRSNAGAPPGPLLDELWKTNQPDHFFVRRPLDDAHGGPIAVESAARVTPRQDVVELFLADGVVPDVPGFLRIHDGAIIDQDTPQMYQS